MLKPVTESSKSKEGTNTITNAYAIASRGREEKRREEKRGCVSQNLELNLSGFANSLTSVQKDSMVLLEENVSFGKK